MKRVQAFMTSDGAVHTSDTQARKHAQRRYDDAMTALRSDLMKYGDGRISNTDATRFLTWAEERFDLFAQAAALKADTILCNPETDEDD